MRFTFATLAKEGSANSLAPEFRLIKSMEVENPHTLTVRFDKPFVVFGNKVNQGLFASVAFIQSKKHVESARGGRRRAAAGRPPGPWKFVEHVRGDRIVYEAVENHWRATPHFKRLVFLKVPEPATRMAMLRAGSVDVIEIGGEYVDELKKVGVRTLVMPNVVVGLHHPRRPVADQVHLRPEGAVGAARRGARRARCAWPSTSPSTSRRSCSGCWAGSARVSGSWLDVSRPIRGRPTR